MHNLDSITIIDKILALITNPGRVWITQVYFKVSFIEFYKAM